MTIWTIQRKNENQVDAEWDRQVRQLLCKCFPHSAGTFAQSRHWHGVAPKWSLWIQDQDNIIAHLCVIDRHVHIGDRPLRVAGIGSVCVLNTYRELGLANMLLKRAMDEARQENFDMGLLFCQEHVRKLYANLGWLKITGRELILEIELGIRTEHPCESSRHDIMYYPLSINKLPDGPLDLHGRDW